MGDKEWFQFAANKCKVVHFTAPRSRAQKPPLWRLEKHICQWRIPRRSLGCDWTRTSHLRSTSVCWRHSARRFSTYLSGCSREVGGDRNTLLMLYSAIVHSKFYYGCIVYGTSSNADLQLDSIHNSGLRLALGACCTSPVPSLYTEASKAPLEECQLKLSSHCYLKTRACIDNPAHHVLHEFDQTTRDLYAPRPNRAGGMTRPGSSRWSKSRGSHDLCRDQCLIGLPPEDTQLSTRNARLRSQETQPQWRSRKMYDIWTRSPGWVKWVSWSTRITWWSLHWWLQNEWESGCSGHHQPPFPEWWDNLLPTVQKTGIKQHHRCSWGYSHQSGTETHGPSPTQCSGPFWLNVLFASNWGWRHREPFICHIMNLLCLLSGTRVRFCWIASHCVIEGNVRVEQLAKETLDQDTEPLANVDYTYMKPLIDSSIQQLAQTKWELAVHGRYLYLLKPTLGPPKNLKHLTRVEEIVITRL